VQIYSRFREFFQEIKRHERIARERPVGVALPRRGNDRILPDARIPAAPRPRAPRWGCRGGPGTGRPYTSSARIVAADIHKKDTALRGIYSHVRSLRRE
jgi:hypothetical protein